MGSGLGALGHGREREWGGDWGCSTTSANAIVHFGSVESASRVFLSALKPTRRVADSNYLDHTATQHWFDRQPPYSPVPVPTSGPPRGCSTSGPINTATKRSLRANASSGSSPRPHTCSLQAGQCSGTWSPPVAVSRPCQRDQAAKFSNRRAGPSADTVIRHGWC